MFQHADDVDADATARVIAPFNRDPTKAARKAFDRDTGVPVRPTQLKTYGSALRNYHNHPEAKFLNGERGDHGATQRRHVVARSIVHIGKEANNLDIQAASGIDPEAQVEFLVDVDKVKRTAAVADAVSRLGLGKVAREAGLSRKHVAAVSGGASASTEATLSNIERAISSLEISASKQSAEMQRALRSLQAECKQSGLRQTAMALGVSASTLSRALSGERRLPHVLAKQINTA